MSLLNHTETSDDAAEEPEILLARSYDRVQSGVGPVFDDRHPRIADPADKAGLLSYLRSGAVLLHTATRLDDVVDRSHRGVVPADFRTDGVWIWTDMVAYYLEHYDLEPDPRLAEHIRVSGYQMPRVTEEAAFRALAVARRPAEQPAPTRVRFS